MPIDTSFLDPIIQAMVAHHNRQYQQAELAQRGKEEQTHAQQFKQEQALREKAQSDLESRIEQEHEMAGKQLDLQTQQVQAQLEGNKLNTLKALQDFADRGGDVSKLATSPSATGNQGFSQNIFNSQRQPGQGDTIKFPGLNFEIPVSAIPGYQQQLARRVGETKALASAQASGTAEGQAPSVQSARDYEKERQNAANDFEREKLNKEQAFTAGQNALQRQNQLDVSKLSKGTQLGIANMENQTRLMQIGAEYGISPEQASAMLPEIYGGGDQKLDLKNPVMRRLNTVAEGQGFKNPGTDVDELKTLDSITPALQKYQDFATNVLSSNKVGRAATQVGAMFGSDAKKKEESLAQYLQQIGKGLEGFSGGRQLAAQFGAESKSMPSLSDTSGQALQKIQDFIDNINSRKSKILSNYTPAQQELFKARNPGVNFDPIPDIIAKKQGATPAAPTAAPNRIKYSDLIGQDQGAPQQ